MIVKGEFITREIKKDWIDIEFLSLIGHPPLQATRLGKLCALFPCLGSRAEGGKLFLDLRLCRYLSFLHHRASVWAKARGFTGDACMPLNWTRDPRLERG